MRTTQIVPTIAISPPREAIYAIASLAYATALVMMSFFLQGRDEFDISDEGFLWYGVQRTIAGEIPIRDFMSYDPSRYFWSAALMTAAGSDGLVALRAAVAGFQIVGLFAGLFVLTKVVPRKPIFLLGAGVILLAWMYPRQKLFDISLSLLLVGVLTWLLEKPTRQRFFVSGMSIGLIATFGRNHGVYGLTALAGALLYVYSQSWNVSALLKDSASVTFGVVVGFFPILLLCIFASGFAAAFWQNIVFLFEYGGTNLALPIPWPWLVSFDRLPETDSLFELIQGLFFVALIAYPAFGLLHIVRKRLRREKVSSAILATSLLAIPYAHVAYSRADIGHLSQAIFPVLIGILLLVSNLRRLPQFVMMVLLTGASLFLILPLQPGWSCRVKVECVSTQVGGSTVRLGPSSASVVTELERLVKNHASDGQGVLILPLWPGAYPVLHRKAPVWEIYALFPRSDEFQRREIERIIGANTSFALILDEAIDNRDDLRFRRTHALIDQFLRDNFDPISGGKWSAEQVQLYKAREPK